MDVLTAIKERRSVRRYQNRQVEEEKLELILEAARLAPSARNLQNWRFLVVRDAELRKQIADIAQQPFVGTAPAIIVGVSTDPDRVMSCEVPAYAVDVTIAMTNITLQAVSLGLGTCWIGAFKQAELKELLNVPAEYKAVLVMPLGYPEDAPKSKHRRPIEQIVLYDKFS